MQKLMAVGVFKVNLSLQSAVVVRPGLVDRRVEETDFGISGVEGNIDAGNEIIQKGLKLSQLCQVSGPD